MAATYVHNITINSSTDFEQIYEIQSTSGKMVDLTGYSAAAQIRKHRESSTAISFTVGFPDRLNGKIKLSIPSWITSRLKSGRRVYDIRFVKPNGEIDIVLEGTVTVVGSPTECAEVSLPNSGNRLCIAIIDESSAQSYADMRSRWEEFRTTYPMRTFYLLLPSSNTGKSTETHWDALRCPDSFLHTTTLLEVQ